jgi:hypothetical protein
VQDNWVKSMQPLAEWLLHSGRPVVEAVRALEARPTTGVAAALSPYAFKAIEQLYDPQDYVALTREMLDEAAKATTVRLGRRSLSLSVSVGTLPALSHRQTHTRARTQGKYDHTGTVEPVLLFEWIQRQYAVNRTPHNARWGGLCRGRNGTPPSRRWWGR